MVVFLKVEIKIKLKGHW